MVIIITIDGIMMMNNSHIRFRFTNNVSHKEFSKFGTLNIENIAFNYPNKNIIKMFHLLSKLEK